METDKQKNHSLPLKIRLQERSTGFNDLMLKILFLLQWGKTSYDMAAENAYWRQAYEKYKVSSNLKMWNEKVREYVEMMFDDE